MASRKNDVGTCRNRSDSRHQRAVPVERSRPTRSTAAGAQAPAQGAGGRQGDAPIYTLEAGAKDLKSVLFNWAWYTGMLRSTEEYNLIMSLVYQGTGTIQAAGQPCNVTM